MAKNPTARLRGSVGKASLVGSRAFPSETIDFRTINALTHMFPVSGLTKVSARIDPSSWGATVVEMKKSIDGVNRTPFSPVIRFNDATPEVFEKDLRGAAFVIFETIVIGPESDSAAQVYVYAFRPNA